LGATEVATQGSIKSQKTLANDDDLLSEGVEEIIAEHGGDVRAAIRALLQSVSYLEAARDRALVLVSYGYARGKFDSP
jgi:hypothetical protein